MLPRLPLRKSHPLPKIVLGRLGFAGIAGPLSEKVYDALQAVDTNLTGNAYAYGENCVLCRWAQYCAAMETDFRVKVTVSDLKTKKRSEIGFPPPPWEPLRCSRRRNPRPLSLVVWNLTLARAKRKNRSLYVLIAKYQKLAPGISGAEFISEVLITIPESLTYLV